MGKLKAKFSKILQNITDDNYRYRLQILVVSLIFCVVSFGMCILNIATDKRALMIATAVFSVISALTFIISLFNERVGIWIFLTSAIVLFVFFLLTGGTEGFSPLWILVFPSSVMLLVGLKRGTIVNAVMLALIVFLLLTPLGNSMLFYDGYTESFKMRFPIVFVAFFVINAFFEYVRALTNDKYREATRALSRSNECNKLLAGMDPLTRIPNRLSFNLYVKSRQQENAHPESLAVCIIDVDNFKQYNDTYGHVNGDTALVSVAKSITSTFSNVGKVYRWGGEEFICLMEGIHEAELRKYISSAVKAVAALEIENKNTDRKYVTISLGAKLIEGNFSIHNIDKFIAEADRLLYTAKDSGKNTFALNCETI